MTINEGWPDSRKKCKQSILENWNHRDELSHANGLIFIGQKLLIPRLLRQELLNSVHLNYLAIAKTIERANDCIIWPGMS